jgi:hypothetical protein
MKDSGEIIKQAYSSFIKNNFVPQQPNIPSSTTILNSRNFVKPGENATQSI